MIYVLFGPPGVGKTYIGQLIARECGLHFFDADLLIDEELKRALQNGDYTQDLRDKFIDKLVATTEHLLAKNGGDLIIAEAFTKEKNRFAFYRHFDGQVCYIMVRAGIERARERAQERLKNGEHVVDSKVFDFVWEEFESPSLKHRILNNEEASAKEIIQGFTDIVEWCEKEGV